MAASRTRRNAEVGHWLIISLATLGYIGALHYSYKLKVSPLYSYQGMTFREPDPVTYLAVIGVTVVIAICMPRRIVRTTDFIVWVLFIVTAIPAIVLAQLNTALPVSKATELGLVVAAIMLLVRAGTLDRARAGKFGRLHVRESVVWVFLGSTAGVTYLLLFVGGSLTYTWVGIDDVYGIRDDFFATTALGIGYLLPVVHNVVNPTFMARGVYSGRWGMFAFGAVGQYVLYASTGQKSILFSVAAVGLIALMFRWRSRPRGVALLTGVALGGLATLAIDAIIGGYTFTSLVIRRFMVIPGALVAGYVATFDGEFKVRFADQLRFFESPYNESAALIVGRSFLNDPGSSANVSLFGDGYANLGYPGVLIEALVLILMLKLVDVTTRGLPVAVTAIVFVMPSIALASGGVTTVALTHAFVAAALVCAALPRTGWGRPPKQPAGGQRNRVLFEKPVSVEARR